MQYEKHLKQNREREESSSKNIYLTLRSFVVCLFFLTSFFAFADMASAATYYWVGGTTNSSTSNPANWNTSAGACTDSANAVLPTTGDTINFVSNCVNDATVDLALSVANFRMELGYTGTTTVSGVSMTVATQLVVNRGTLYITNGGTVTAPPGSGSFIIGWPNTSNGTITVNGASSTLTQTIIGDTRLRIGNDAGAVGNLNILNGAVVNTGSIHGAYSAGATANIIVDGAGTIWNSDIAGYPGYIGRAGTATLTISNGAVVNTSPVAWHIGGFATGIGSVNVTGTGSRLNVTNSNLRIGYTGTGTVNVNDGGIINISGERLLLIVADLAGSTGTLNIGTGYTTDVILVTGGIIARLGTASLPPIATTTITASNISTNSINWDWGDDSRATGYKVYRSSDDTLLATISSSTSNWTQESLSSNTPYSIYVRGTNAQGEGLAYSDSPEVYTLDNPTSSGSSVSRRIKNLIDLGKTQEAKELQEKFPNVTPIVISQIPQDQNTKQIRDLSLGSQGDDVKTLQIILNLMGYTVSPSGFGSPNNESDYFGEKTKQAVIKFQIVNNITPAEGYFGPKTRDILIIKLIKFITS